MLLTSVVVSEYCFMMLVRVCALWGDWAWFVRLLVV
jgi:hypothetical protein